MFDIFNKDFDLLKWLGFKGKPKPIRLAHGETRTMGPHGETVLCDTLQCCHCGGHFEVVSGSGRLRGFCLRHNAVTCGRPECMMCLDKEQRLDNIEKGLPELTVPTAVHIAVK